MPDCPHEWHDCSPEAIVPLPHPDETNAYATRQDGYCLGCGQIRVRLLSLDGRWSPWRLVPVTNGPRNRRVSSLRYASRR